MLPSVRQKQSAHEQPDGAESNRKNETLSFMEKLVFTAS